MQTDVTTILGFLGILLGTISLIAGVGYAATNLDSLAADARRLADYLTPPN